MVTDIAQFFILFIFGAVIGSFINVVILRYIADENIAVGRSRCPNCRKVLRWWELIPVFSFVFLWGKCARCHKRISIQYPVVECVTGGLAAVIGASLFDAGLGVVTTTFIVAAILVILFVIDLYTMLLPDIFVGILVVPVAIQLFILSASPLGILYGVVAGAGFLLLLWLVTRGKGIGLGDIKLMIPLGALFGGRGTITLLFLAFIAGGLVSIFLLAHQQAKLKTQIPFGPFLAGAAILLLLFPGIISWFNAITGLSIWF